MNPVKNKTAFVFFFEIFIAITLVVISVVWSASQNYGLEGDEVFSFLSASSQGGYHGICFLDDQTWYPTEYFSDALTSTGTERFNIPMVAENQTMDTHPPLYYIFLNFVCSLFPGQYSHWFGIVLNLLFLLLAGTGLFLLFETFIHRRQISLLFTTVFCCSYLAVNMALFIRMYVLLMAVFIYQSWYHLRLYRRMSVSDYCFRKHRHTYILLSILTIAGGMVHYYFLIWQLLIAALLIFGLWRGRQYHNIMRYIGTMAVSAIIYIILYPASLYHMFLKYRGREAVYNFFQRGSFIDTTQEIFRQMDQQLFKGAMIPVVLVIAAVTAYLVWKRKMTLNSCGKGLLLLLPSLIYMVGISKASPFISIRYISPVTPFVFAGLILCLLHLTHILIHRQKAQKIALGILCLVVVLLSFNFRNHSFRPPYFTERKAIVDAMAEEISQCVYVSGDDYNWKMWEDYVNYPVFQSLFFIDGQEKAPIVDQQLLQAGQLVIYIDTALNQEEICQYLQQYLQLDHFELAYQTSYTYIYRFSQTPV